MEQQQLNIDLANAQEMRCASCNGKFFEQATMFRKVSKLLTGSPKDVVVPIQAFRCQECGEVLTELLPDFLKQDGKEETPQDGTPGLILPNA